MVAKMKILQTEAPDTLTDKINAHLTEGYKIAGNSYTVTQKSPGKLVYSILMMLVPVEELPPDRLQDE